MKPWGLPDWMRQAICDAYAAKEKVEAIGAEFGVTPTYVCALARRRGLSRRQVRKVEHSSVTVLVSETVGCE